MGRTGGLARCIALVTLWALVGCDGESVVGGAVFDATVRDLGVDAKTPVDDTVTVDVTAPDVPDVAMDLGPRCGTGQMLCGDNCASVSTDPLNCGACGRRCSDAERCVDGACRVACPGGQVACPDGDDAGAALVCVINATDRNHCGGCGRRCGAGQVCSMGVCTTSCSELLVTCRDGAGTPVCADLRRDPLNCGACGVGCAPGQTCETGRCVTTCAVGFTPCTVGGDAGVDGGALDASLDGAVPAGYCADLQVDRNNCGACGNACAAGQVCDGARCVLSCAAGLTSCDGSCRDLQLDRAHCGMCGRACDAGQVCSMGACVVSCAVGTTSCGGSCRDVQTDRANCGACGHACDAGQVCSMGACVVSCAAGATDCGGSCRDLQTDRAHCGMCGRTCDAGQVCSAGACVLSCAAGTTSCGGSCRDVQTDRLNCGRCGAVCGTGEACVMGACALSCAASQSVCAGACRDLQTDVNHCGMCGRACAAGQACTAGACTISCPAGQTPCGDTCRDVQTDRAHCGACGRACGAGEICAGGSCLVSCLPGQTACAGACRDVQTDRAHCGMCGRACAAGEVCVMGACALDCPTGQVGCAGACRDLQTDRAHCGMCGRACAAGQVCSMGACVVSCGAGLTECSGVCRDTSSDNNHCGACGNACPAGQVCLGSACSTRCPGTQTACAGMCVSTRSDPDHCGMCGNACASPSHGVGVCATSTCSFVCTAGYADCDRAATNGCEALLASDDANCGACGTVCSGGTRCISGRCTWPSCRELHAAAPSLPSGVYFLDTDGTGPRAPFRAYCDMVTDGGGWTLAGRSRPGGNASTFCQNTDGGTSFGWRYGQGSLDDDSAPYSLNVAGVALGFTQVLFGNYTSGKTWGDRRYRHTVPTDFLDRYRTSQIMLGAPTELSPAACTDRAPYAPSNPQNPGPGPTGAMFLYMGYTDNGDSFALRDVLGAGFGLFTSGFLTCYQNDNCYAGAVNRQQGMIMVR